MPPQVCKRRIADKPTIIYVCCDIHDLSPRYVGKTTRKLADRIREHRNNKASNYSAKWFRKHKGGHYFVLETVPPGQDWVESEQFWIAYLKHFGSKLVNSTIGGEGVSGIKRSDTTKKKLSDANIGRKMSESTKQAMRDAWNAPGYREKASLRNKIRLSDPEVRRNLSEKNKGKTSTAETIAKRSVGIKESWAKKKANGYVVSDSARDKMSKAKRGKLMSVSTREKMKTQRSTPEARSANSARVKAYAATDKGKKSLSERALKQWETKRGHPDADCNSMVI